MIVVSLSYGELNMKMMDTQQKLNKCAFPAASLTNEDIVPWEKEVLPKVTLGDSDSPVQEPGF